MSKPTRCPDFKEYIVSSDGCFLFHQIKTSDLLAYDVFFLEMQKIGRLIFWEDDGEVKCRIVDPKGKDLATVPDTAYRQCEGDLAIFWTSGVNIVSGLFRAKLKLRKLKPSK